MKTKEENMITNWKNDRDDAYMNDVGYHTFLDQVTTGPL
jgi:hypothetical protein